MNTQPRWKRITQCAVLATGLLIAVDCNAWVAYHSGNGYYRGGAYHGNYYRNGNYYRGGYYGRVGYYGAPYGAYYAPRCTYMQQCYPNGVCVNKRICR